MPLINRSRSANFIRPRGPKGWIAALVNVKLKPFLLSSLAGLLVIKMTRPWVEIGRFCSTLEDVQAEAMQQLVSAIESSAFAAGVFGWTSMMNLCIAQSPVEHPYNGPYLRISPKTKGMLEFRYLDTWDEGRQWCRMVPQDMAFERLQRFFAELHWFPSSECQ